MALRRIELPWDSQPQEFAPANSRLNWGLLLSGAQAGTEVATGRVYTQFNASHMLAQQVRDVGACFAPSGTQQNAAVSVAAGVAPAFGAVIGASLFWYGSISAVTNNSIRDVLFCRNANNTVSAIWAGQTRLRVSISHEILVDVHTGSAFTTASTGLTVTYGVPLAILVRFTAAGVEVVSTVGSVSVSVSGMVSAVGSSTATGAAVNLGTTQVAFNGHLNQACAIAGWSPGWLPEYLVKEPWQAFEPQTIFVPVAAAGSGQDSSGGSSATVTVSATGAGQGAEAASGGASAVATVSAAGAGTAIEAASGGASAAVTVSAAGAGTAADGATGGASATVNVTAAGAGTAAEAASGGAAATVVVTATGGSEGSTAERRETLGGRGSKARARDTIVFDDAEAEEHMIVEIITALAAAGVFA